MQKSYNLPSIKQTLAWLNKNRDIKFCLKKIPWLLFPLAYYYLSILLGALPDPDAWHGTKLGEMTTDGFQKTNHGPWNLNNDSSSITGLLLVSVYPLVVLAIGFIRTFFNIVMYDNKGKRSYRRLTISIVILLSSLALELVYWLIYMKIAYWTVD